MKVCYPYEFTLLSNLNLVRTAYAEFVTPMNLHCSQTNLMILEKLLLFVTPMNLHCSQTLLLRPKPLTSLLPL